MLLTEAMPHFMVILIPTREAADFVGAAMTDATALKLLGMNQVEQLGQDEFAGGMTAQWRPTRQRQRRRIQTVHIIGLAFGPQRSMCL